MELIDIEEARVIHLVHLRRPAGQLFVPEAAAKLVARYQFTKYPSIQDLAERKESISFGVGKFADSQIQMFSIYGDGFVAEARSNTKILDAFLDDAIEWASKELGLEPLANTKIERHHEGSIIVRSSKDIAKAVNPSPEIAAEFNKALQKENYAPRKFLMAGFIMASDPVAEGSRKKEPRFVVDRRVGVPFSENTFYSQAPLSTDDHLAFLERVEALAR